MPKAPLQVEELELELGRLAAGPSPFTSIWPWVLEVCPAASSCTHHPHPALQLESALSAQAAQLARSQPESGHKEACPPFLLGVPCGWCGVTQGQGRALFSVTGFLAQLSELTVRHQVLPVLAESLISMSVTISFSPGIAV